MRRGGKEGLNVLLLLSSLGKDTRIKRVPKG